LTSGETEDDSELLDKYEDLKDDSYHEAVTYLLQSDRMSASSESIELLLEHKFYWCDDPFTLFCCGWLPLFSAGCVLMCLFRDAAVLARRYLTPTNEMFQKTFSKWANVFIDKEKSSCGDKKAYKADAAKWYDSSVSVR
jgi:hypothetical protein